MKMFTICMYGNMEYFMFFFFFSELFQLFRRTINGTVKIDNFMEIRVTVKI